VSWAGESQIDELARRLGIDPIELRLKNLLVSGDTTVTGEVISDVGLGSCLRAVTDAARQWPKPAVVPGKKVGRGYGVVMKSTLTPTVTFGTVRMNLDGSVEVMSAAVEVGQGAKTILAQIVAEELALPLDQVRVAPTDTLISPYDRSSTSSRTTFSMGNAIGAAAGQVREQLLEIAGEVLEVLPDHLELFEGSIRLKGSSCTALTYVDAMAKYFKGPGMIVGEGQFGTHKTYDPMDPDTGQSTHPSAFWSYAVAVDAGRAINPMSCEQQITGSAVMGFSMAMMERLEFQEGFPVNATFLDYKIPTSLDVPELEAIVVETPDSGGRYGARGVGEVGLPPVPPAIGNAVLDATGVQLTSLPIRAEETRRRLQDGNI
jgi:carbon-monoxide dehydrogenase large subunit